ncbi:AraC family transcriptional regulator [Actinoplanes sp. RD1]|uniref:AraC family transcriptional regulator n=1 Tax=Actinoplanes sp. RD1 TaxID=3064538 RepID=UPI002740B103|nr:AraC family transcriptional regulator [Actinoplanes sp. RD1]
MPASEVQHHNVFTTDREVAAAALNRLVAHRPRLAFGEPGGVQFRIRSANCGEFGADLAQIEHGAYGSVTPPTDLLVAGVLARGRGRLATARQEVVLGRDDAFLGPVNVEYEAEFVNPAMMMVRLPFAYAARMAEELTGLPAAALRFDGSTAVSASMGRHWAATAGYLGSQLVDTRQALPVLVVGQLQRLAAVALIATFPNTTMTAARLPASGDAAPAVVRRAVAYVDGHADQPLTVDEIAAAAGVGVRALQIAFRRHLETTPMGYLRRVRREYAHRDLRAATPADGTTVTGVARRWGFTDVSRFSAAYREAYGQSPSRTLRT